MNSERLCHSIAGTLPDLFECSPAPQEGVRVRTPFMYPDGGLVDVFVLEHDSQYRVTDFGETLGWLRMQSVTARRSPRQRRMIEDTCQTLGVELHRGQLVLRLGTADVIAEAVLRLAQAAVRVSDLWFTLRTRAVETASDEVDEWLVEKEIAFDRAIPERGRSGQSWTIDYRTHTHSRTSLVFLLSTGSRGAARRIAEHVLAGCVDLSHLKASQPRLTLVSLFDDTEDIWQDNDFGLVEQYSEVARWSRPDEFERILKAPPRHLAVERSPSRTM